MIGNSGAPLEHLVHPAVCNTLGFGAKRLQPSRLGTYFFRKWGRGGRGPGVAYRERALGSPTHPQTPGPGPPRRLAAKNGEGELCTALKEQVQALCVCLCFCFCFVHTHITHERRAQRSAHHDQVFDVLCPMSCSTQHAAWSTEFPSPTSPLAPWIAPLELRDSLHRVPHAAEANGSCTLVTVIHEKILIVSAKLESLRKVPVAS
jgi:hypothetical protein